MVSQRLKYAKYYMGVLWKNWTQTRESYAQHGEDLLVESLLGNTRSFIDVGANDGVLFSNTYKFAKAGARGLCFEPSLATYRKLRLNHLFHPRVKCFRQAVSDQAKDLPFVEEGYEGVLSRVGVEGTGNGSARTVPAVTLAQMLDRYPTFQKIDLLSVDVEGHEREVFDGLGEKSIEASIIIVEADKADPEALLSHSALQAYEPRFRNGVNYILLHNDQPQPTSDLPLPKNFQPC